MGTKLSLVNLCMRLTLFNNTRKYILVDLYHPNAVIDIPELGWLIKIIGMYKFWGEHGQEVAFANILTNDQVQLNFWTSVSKYKSLFNLR